MSICDRSTVDDMSLLHGQFRCKVAGKSWAMGTCRVQIMFLPSPFVSLCAADGCEDIFGLAWIATYFCGCLVTDPVMHKIWSIE